MTAYTVKLKRSANAGGIPTTSDLALGELAVNTTDGKLFTKKSVNGTESIVTLGGSVWDASGTNIFATGKDLGLGVTSPLSVFHIKDDAARILFHNDNTGAAAGNGLLLGLGASNDANAYLMQQNNEHLHIGTNDTTRIFVKNDGKVGVNTETVVIGSRMDIHGGADATNIVGISGSDQTSEYLGLGVGGGKAIITAGNSASGNTDLAFRTSPGGNEEIQMILTDDGNLGIGLTNISGNGSITILAEEELKFAGSGGNTIYGSITADTNHYLRFKNNNGQERLTIAGNGAIGINETNPGNTLDINCGTQNNGVKLTSTDAGSYIQFADDSTTGETRCGAVGNDYKIDVNSGERLRIGSGGDVAIGGGSITSISGYTVLALNNATQGGAIELKRNDVSYGRLLQGSNAVILESRQSIPLEFGINGAKKAFLSSGGTFSVIGGGSDSLPAVSLNGSAASSSLIVTSGGNVAIGQTTATARFEVKGESDLSGTAYSYLYATNNGMRVTGHESALDLVSDYDGNHASSILLRANNVGFGFVHNKNSNILEINSFTASAANFHIHGSAGTNLSAYKKVAGFSKDGGIVFNGDTSAANALDDYEEGTFTPTISFGGTSTGITYGGNTGGSYTKIGRMVYVHIRIELTNKGTSTGAAVIPNLPFNAGNIQSGNSSVEAAQAIGGYQSDAFIAGMSSTTVSAAAWISVNTNDLNLVFNDYDSGDLENMSHSNFTNSSSFAIDFVYQV